MVTERLGRDDCVAGSGLVGSWGHQGGRRRIAGERDPEERVAAHTHTHTHYTAGQGMAVQEPAEGTHCTAEGEGHQKDMRRRSGRCGAELRLCN